MPNQKDLEEVIEILKEVIDFDWRGLDQESYKKGLRPLLSLAQTTLALMKSGMPKEQSLIKCPHGEISECESCELQNRFINVYNQARQEMIAWWSGRIDKERIRKIFDQFIEVGENKLKMMYDKEMADKLTQFIWNYLIGKED